MESDGGHMGEFMKIVNEARCSILDSLKWFSHRGGESGQYEQIRTV